MMSEEKEKKDLSSKSCNVNYGETVTIKKYTRCWNCQLNGYNILDDSGCCQRCGTNLKKWPTRKSLPYPNTTNSKIATEVLGHRKNILLTPYGYEEPSEEVAEVNPLQQIIHRGDQIYRVDPKCYKCDKVATRELAKTNKNGTKIYICDDCYDLSIEWEITPPDEVNYQALYVNNIESYWRKRQENET